MSRTLGRVEADNAEWIIFEGHPSWRSMLGLHLRGFVLAIGAGVLAGVLSTAITGHTEAGWVIFAVLAVFVLVLGRGTLARRRTTYIITSERLTIAVGLLAREVHETRLEQVQNVASSQSLLERALGIGSVRFDTAGGAAFDFAFCGVADPRRIVRTVNDALRERSTVRV